MSASPPLGDDMVDGDEELPSHSALRPAIQLATATLLPCYHNADQRAKKQQTWHRGMAALAAILGTLAVLLAILQLSHLIPGPIPAGVEITAVIISGAAVVFGVLVSFQRHWLLERHKAERCRLLKFRFVIDPAFWCTDADGQERRRAQLRSDTESIGNLTAHGLEDWLRIDFMTESPALKGNCAAESETLRAIVDYYRKKRLSFQMRFFDHRLTQYQARQRLTWRFPPWFFFGSVIAALAHFIVDVVKHGEAGTLSVILILLSAGLPALGAGVRTYRSTYEFARNAMRYEAKLLALRRLDESLAVEIAQTPFDTRRIFHDLWCCEQVLEFEHREWLRLMIEAEWYG
jgi:hypothetical protein